MAFRAFSYIMEPDQPGWGPFLESPGYSDTFRARKAIFSSSASNYGEVFTTSKTCCMKEPLFILRICEYNSSAIARFEILRVRIVCGAFENLACERRRISGCHLVLPKITGPRPGFWISPRHSFLL